MIALRKPWLIIIFRATYGNARFSQILGGKSEHPDEVVVSLAAMDINRILIPYSLFLDFYRVGFEVKLKHVVRNRMSNGPFLTHYWINIRCILSRFLSLLVSLILNRDLRLTLRWPIRPSLEWLLTIKV
jgi:hypothetical protein